MRALGIVNSAACVRARERTGRMSPPKSKTKTVGESERERQKAEAEPHSSGFGSGLRFVRHFLEEPPGLPASRIMDGSPTVPESERPSPVHLATEGVRQGDYRGRDGI